MTKAELRMQIVEEQCEIGELKVEVGELKAQKKDLADRLREALCRSEAYRDLIIELFGGALLDGGKDS